MPIERVILRGIDACHELDAIGVAHASILNVSELEMLILKFAGLGKIRELF